MLPHTLLPLFLGLGTGLSLIIAIGAQNAYLLRLSINGSRRIILPAVTLCALSDAVLIAAGTLGVGVVLQHAPVTIEIVRAIGAAFLICYGMLAAKRAWRPSGESLIVLDSDDAPRAGAPRKLGPVLLTVLALTWLNPHAYLDDVVFLGSLANQQAADEKWIWVAGAVLGSFVWFYALGFGARLLRPFFAKAVSWRILDGLIAVIMVALGAKLIAGL